jgi:carbonic anhydrase/acetyltransferase-like protein (isoleucine patch superfamily)
VPTVLSVNGHTPTIDAAAFLASNATVVGHVTIGARTSLWYGCVVRSELASVTIGEGSNLQDLTVVHTDADAPVVVGDRVTVGHRVILHGCVVEDDALIGMGAVIMNHAVIGRGAVVAAGAVVTEGTRVPPMTLAVGVPAKVVERPVPDVPRPNVATYERLSELHRLASGA